MKLLTLDFETVPDVGLTTFLTGKTCSDWPSGFEALAAYSKEKNHGEEKMLPPPMNRIVAAGIHVAEIRTDQDDGEWYETTHLSSAADPEPVIVKNLVGWLDRIAPRLVTFNGRSFDIPLLLGRALMYRIPVPFWFKSGDRYSNYTNRYNHDWHMDLCDVLCGYGSTARMKLREYMALLQLPDKVYQGGQVQDLFLAGKIAQIRDYGELDALNEFILYCNVQLLQGSITQNGYYKSLASVLQFLQSHQDQEHLRKFLSEWTSLDASLKALLPQEVASA